MLDKYAAPCWGEVSAKVMLIDVYPETTELTTTERPDEAIPKMLLRSVRNKLQNTSVSEMTESKKDNAMELGDKVDAQRHPLAAGSSKIVFW